MDSRQIAPPPRWRKIPNEGLREAEAFLRAREALCVAACARFLGANEGRGHIWRLDGKNGEISALLIHSRRSLFPVFDKNPRISGPRFLNRFLGKVPIHALQGLKEDVELLEGLMEEQGYVSSERIDYDLMSIDRAPRQGTAGRSLEGLILRPPRPEDTESLVALQAAYEKEEVLPENAVFNPAASRYNLIHILAHEHILAAELNGRIVGKINTSAESFTRYQIGGVYVRPDCRGLGIATRMTAAFIQRMLASGKALTLFVKKHNAAAREVYRKTGFSTLADYRISYY